MVELQFMYPFFNYSEVFFIIQEGSLNFKRDDEFGKMLRHVPIEETHL
jgi:hypothetical protein